MLPYKFESILRTPSLMDAKVSPDGKVALWTWNYKDVYRNVYSTTLDSGSVVRLTKDDTNYRLCNWSTTGERVVVKAELSTGGFGLYALNPLCVSTLESLVESNGQLDVLDAEYDDRIRVVYFTAIARSYEIPLVCWSES